MPRFLLLTVMLLPLSACTLFGAKDEEDEGDTTEDTQTQDTSGGGGGSVYEDFCDELDECNLLKGMSAGECAGAFESCTDDLLESEAGDVEAAMEECLAESGSCDELSACYWYDVPYC